MHINKNDFPILQQQMHQHDMVYLDNAATSQKPQVVIDAITKYYQLSNANVHRGIYELSQHATEAYEQARDKVTAFLHAQQREEVLFTRGTTESLNWIACTYGIANVHSGDEIVLSYMEHHANIVPWQQLAKKVNAKLKYIALNDDGTLNMADAQKQITSRTKIVAVAHASNVLGVINPIKKLADLAHQHGAVIVVDGAQSTPHMPVDVQQLQADFFAFSGHKMLGPMGIGVLYGKRQLLEAMPPAQFGGEMIERVGLLDATFQPLPWKFEAGTPNVAGAIGLGVAIDYLNQIGMDNVQQHEKNLVNYILPKLSEIDGVRVYGPQAANHSGVIAFNVDQLHPHDLATALDQQGVAIRAGHHCAQPLMHYLNVSATARASFYIYNTMADADKLVDSIMATKEYFNHGIRSFG